MTLVFDVETNRLSAGDGVLSFSALLLDGDGDIVEEVNRYYHRPPEIPEGREALEVNGLWPDEIDRRRAEQGADYPRFFGDDSYIADLFSRADTLVAHNIGFDLKHIQRWHDISTENKELYCTMESTKWLYDYPYLKNGEPKWPRLSEAAEHFDIDLQKIAERTGLEFHDSLFDVYVTAAVYRELQAVGEEEIERARAAFFGEVRKAAKEEKENDKSEAQKRIKRLDFGRISEDEAEEIWKDYGVKFKPGEWVEWTFDDEFPMCEITAKDQAGRADGTDKIVLEYIADKLTELNARD
jgi:DNA polymerase-3 subunit epsilon